VRMNAGRSMVSARKLKRARVYDRAVLVCKEAQARARVRPCCPLCTTADNAHGIISGARHCNRCICVSLVATDTAWLGRLYLIWRLGTHQVGDGEQQEETVPDSPPAKLQVAGASPSTKSACTSALYSAQTCKVDPGVNPAMQARPSGIAACTVLGAARCTTATKVV
jgi:hypothetical protein